MLAGKWGAGVAWVEQRISPRFHRMEICFNAVTHPAWVCRACLYWNSWKFGVGAHGSLLFFLSSSFIFWWELLKGSIHMDSTVHSCIGGGAGSSRVCTAVYLVCSLCSLCSAQLLLLWFVVCAASALWCAAMTVCFSGVRPLLSVLGHQMGFQSYWIEFVCLKFGLCESFKFLSVRMHWLMNLEILNWFNKTGLTRIPNFLLIPQLVEIEMQKCNMINLCLLVDLNIYSQS